MNALIAVQTALRTSEQVVKLAEVKVPTHQRDCFLVLVSNREQSHDLAVMLFKPRKMFTLHGKVTLLFCFPVTRELRVEVSGKTLKLQWLEYQETVWRVSIKDRDLADHLLLRLRQHSTYQRDCFHTGASSHRWIWFYEEGIPAQVRSLEFNTTSFERRATTQFMPEDYGSEAMNFYIHNRLKKREAEFMQVKHLNAFVGTWNCAGEAPRDTIVPWLRQHSVPGQDPDILVIGLQEACELTPTRMLGDPDRVRDWIFFLCNELRQAFRSRYLMIVQKDLVGLVLVVFVYEAHHVGCKFIDSAAIKLGFKGFVGNKGAVVARFNLYDSTFFVVNGHFEAHEEYVNYRNENFKNVVRTAKLRAGDEVVSMHEHDVVFFIGDLNYRLQGITTTEINSLLERVDLDGLALHDQLLIEKMKGNIFMDFSEGKLAFLPTFKFVKGSNTYIHLGKTAGTKRDPAWCDRILYRGDVELLCYDSCTEIMQSDHKPVVAKFNIKVNLT
mmetsp:Transcript_22732/g.40891  ORF Transcript_22732/g.40891 Transcript_22732/m.40891 type:complete len:498 (+) Transcript_22732:748-2241(+)